MARSLSRIGARRLIVLSVSVTVVAALLPALTTTSASAAGGPSTAYRANDYADGQAMSILPPGENGLANAADVAQVRAARPATAGEQRPAGQVPEPALRLVDADRFQLVDYYNDESFGVRPADIVRTETPGPA